MTTRKANTGILPFDFAQGQDDDTSVWTSEVISAVWMTTRLWVDIEDVFVRWDLKKMERNPSDFLPTSGAKSSAWLAG
jgi:hypothetical protein